MNNIVYVQDSITYPDMDGYDHDALFTLYSLLDGDFLDAAQRLFDLLSVEVFGGILASGGPVNENDPFIYPDDVNDPGSVAYVIFEVWEKIRDILNGEYDGAASGQVFDAQNSQVIISSGGTEGAGTPGNPVMTGTSVTLECEAVQQPWVYSGFCPDPLYSWVFGDGTGLSASSSNQLASHVYNQPGSYEAQCTVHCPTVVFAVGQQLEAAATPPNVSFSEDENQKYGFHRDDSPTYWKSLKAGGTDTVKINVVPSSAFDQVTVSSPESGLTASPQILSQVPEVITVGDLNGQDGVVDALFGSQVIDNLNVQVYEEITVTVAYRRVDSRPHVGLAYPGFTSADLTDGLDEAQAASVIAAFEQSIRDIWTAAVVNVELTRLPPCQQELGGSDFDHYDYYGYLPVPQGAGTATTEMNRIRQECTSGDHQYTVFFVDADLIVAPNESHPNGHAPIGGTWAFVYLNRAANPDRTFAHELGHMFQLPHDVSNFDNLMRPGTGTHLNNQQWDQILNR